MKKVVSVVLAILIVVLSFKDVFVFADFYWNQDFIAKTLCINKDKPEMKCNGKCHLSKVIKEIQDQEDKSPDSKEENRFSTVYVVAPLSSFTFNNPTIINKRSFFIKNETYIFNFLNKVFHPPRFC